MHLYVMYAGPSMLISVVNVVCNNYCGKPQSRVGMIWISTMTTKGLTRVAVKKGIFLLCLFLLVNYWTTVRDSKLPGHMCHMFYEGALMVQFF